MIEQPRKNEEKVGDARAGDCEKEAVSTLQVGRSVGLGRIWSHSPSKRSPSAHPVVLRGRKEGRTGGSCKSKPNGQYSLSLFSLSKSRREEKRSGAVGQRFIRHCRQVHAQRSGRKRTRDHGLRRRRRRARFLTPNPVLLAERRSRSPSLLPSLLLFLRCSF